MNSAEGRSNVNRISTSFGVAPKTNRYKATACFLIERGSDISPKISCEYTIEEHGFMLLMRADRWTFKLDYDLYIPDYEGFLEKFGRKFEEEHFLSKVRVLFIGNYNLKRDKSLPRMVNLKGVFLPREIEEEEKRWMLIDQVGRVQVVAVTDDGLREALEKRKEAQIEKDAEEKRKERELRSRKVENSNSPVSRGVKGINENGWSLKEWDFEGQSNSFFSFGPSKGVVLRAKGQRERKVENFNSVEREGVRESGWVFDAFDPGCPGGFNFSESSFGGDFKGQDENDEEGGDLTGSRLSQWMSKDVSD